MSLVRRCDLCHKICDEDKKVFLITIIQYSCPSVNIDEFKTSGNDVCDECRSKIVGRMSDIARDRDYY